MIETSRPGSIRKRWFVLAAIGMTAAVVVLAISLTGTEGGEAADKLAVERAREKALPVAKTIIPEADSMTEMPEYDGSDGCGFALNDKNGNMVAGIVVDKTTGEIDFMVDIRAESYRNISGEVNVGIDDATKSAQEFFSSRGVDLSEYGLERDPLHAVATNTTDMDNPVPIYQYDFYYRIQKDGIPVYDLIHGGGYCSISISPEDGKILAFMLPQNDFSVKDKSTVEIEIDKEEAIMLAVDNVLKADRIKGVPVLSDREVELSYMVDGSTLVPYWTVKIDLYEGGISTSGVDISISAVDGSVVGEGRR